MTEKKPTGPDLLKVTADDVSKEAERRLEPSGERLFPASFAASGTPINVSAESVSIRVDREE